MAEEYQGMGAYVRRNLIPDEHVVYEARLHWIRFFTSRAFGSLFLAPLIDGLTSEFVVTNKRVIFKRGLVSRWTLELNLQKVEMLHVNQTIWQRLLGYGDLTVHGTGGSIERFEHIADPVRFRQEVQRQSHV